MRGVEGVRPTACGIVRLRFQYAHKALQHGSIVGHWLTHVGVVFQASMNARVLFVVPFPTTEALVLSNAKPVVRQCRARNSLDFQSFWYLSLGMPIFAISHDSVNGVLNAGGGRGKLMTHAPPHCIQLDDSPLCKHIIATQTTNDN